MYIILGYGYQAKAIARYLLTHTTEQIATIDPIRNPHDHFPDLSPGRLIHHYGCAEQVDLVPGATVISCLPTQMNVEIAERCYTRKCHYIDLGGDIEVTKKIQDIGEKADITSFIPDCGVAPGLVSSIAAHALELGYKGIDIYCGGIPLYPELPLGYLESFSTEGVIKEYTDTCDIRLNGEYKVIPALSEKELIFFPGLGVLEAEPTSGSISLAAQELPLCDLNYKTLRYPGHWEYIKNHVLTQPNPTQVLKRILCPVTRDNPDLLIMQVELFNHIEGDEDKIYKWRWDYNHREDISAMAEITGYTVASVATLCHEGVLMPGFIPMHSLPFAELKNRIKKMSDMFIEVI